MPDTVTRTPTAEDIRPGVVLLVPAGADPLRPARPYRIRVSAAWPNLGGRIRIDGRLERLDGTPTGRRFPTRAADLIPAEVKILED